MSNLYVLQNQDGYFLKKSSPGKAKEWGDGQEPQSLFRTMHKDEALNMLVETNSQNVELRIHIKEYEINAKKHPIIPEEDLPPPLPKDISESSPQGDDGQEDPLLPPLDTHLETHPVSQ